MMHELSCINVNGNLKSSPLLIRVYPLYHFQIFLTVVSLNVFRNTFLTFYLGKQHPVLEQLPISTVLRISSSPFLEIPSDLLYTHVSVLEIFTILGLFPYPA